MHWKMANALLTGNVHFLAGQVGHGSLVLALRHTGNLLHWMFNVVHSLASPSLDRLACQGKCCFFHCSTFWIVF